MAIAIIHHWRFKITTLGLAEIKARKQVAKADYLLKLLVVQVYVLPQIIRVVVIQTDHMIRFPCLFFIIQVGIVIALLKVLI